MTDLLARPQTQRPAPARRSVELAGALAAVLAAGIGLVAVAVVVLLAWVADTRSGTSARTALRTAGQVWLVAHHTGLALPGGWFGLTPLGLTLLPAALLVRGARGLVGALRITTPRQAARVLAAYATTYALVGAGVAGLTPTSAVAPSIGQAVAGTFVLATMAGGLGLLSARGGVRTLVAFLPQPLRAVVVGAAAAVCVVIAAGAVLVGVALAVHAGRAGSLAETTGPGFVGGVALLCLGLGYVPTAALWGASYVVGPGFAVGAGTRVAAFGESVGAVPGVPLLAALPGSAPGPLLGVSCLGLMFAAGGLAGGLAARVSVRRTRDALLVGFACGPVAGAALAGLAFLAHGPLGPGRMATVGPSPWQIGLAATAQIGAGAALASWLVHRRR